MIIIRGTTAELTFDVKSDLSEAQNIYVTILTGDKEMTITSGLVYADGAITVHLSQKDSLRLHPGICRIKINWTYPGGDRGTTDYAIAQVYDNRPNRVLK